MTHMFCQSRPSKNRSISVSVKALDVRRSVCSSFHSLAMNILRHADTGAFII